MAGKYPQVLLLGNGLNRAFGGLDWTVLIEELYDNPRVNLKDIKKMSSPLQVILATGDNIADVLNRRPELLYGVNDKNFSELKCVLEKLLKIPFDCILTTNYGYELERTANASIGRDGRRCEKMQVHTDEVPRAEQKYMLHTYNRVVVGDFQHKIWHIHGECRKRESIVLGHYEYGRLLQKIQNLLDERGNKQKKRQDFGRNILIESWVDSFVMGDVYVLGQGLDFSEVDLWWLINRKHREKAVHGKIHFYSSSSNPEKLSLLKTFDADIKTLGYYGSPGDYRLFYREAIEDIAKEVFKKIE